MLSPNSLSMLQTGDVLLFSGKGLSSDLIRWFTGSRWTHVGVIVRFDEVDEPLLLESNPGPESADLFSGEALAGVSLVPLTRKLADYDGDIILRRREGAQLCPRQRRLVRRLVSRLYRRPYRNYLLRQVMDALPGRDCRDYSAIFCSELVAEFYRRLGWLPREIRTGRIFPGHFADASLTLLGGELQQPVWLKSVAEQAAVHDPEKNSQLAVAGR